MQHVAGKNAIKINISYYSKYIFVAWLQLLVSVTYPSMEK